MDSELSGSETDLSNGRKTPFFSDTTTRPYTDESSVGIKEKTPPKTIPSNGRKIPFFFETTTRPQNKICNQKNFEGKVLRYLGNITMKLINLKEQVSKLDRRVTMLGKANCDAFLQCKTTIGGLANNQSDVYEELLEAAGKLQENLWN